MSAPVDRLRIAAYAVDHRVRTAVNRRRELRYDRSRGVDTVGRHGLSAAAQASSAFAHAGIYQGAPARHLTELLAALPLRAADATFVDLGCGKGKALFVAAEAGFARSVGVEFDPELAARAQANAAAFAARQPQAGPVDVVCEDAGAYRFPDGPVVVFLFNPFTEVIMRRVQRNLDQSVQADPRPVCVVYLNARHPQPWLESEVLRPVPLPEHLLQPAPLRLFRGLREHEHGADLRTLVVGAGLPR